MSESKDSTFFEINGWKVYYEKIGTGPHPILLIPGPIGTGRTDFEELLDSQDELDFDKFTAIAVEAPGWGRSRPPARKYGTTVYDNDCQCFFEVMKRLQFQKYSIIGFSEGAKVALLMAIEFPESVISLVLSALKIQITSKGLINLLLTKNVDKWEKDKIESYLKVYHSKDEIQKLWNRYLKFAESHNIYFSEDIFKEKYHLVKCPVLITHGDRDLTIGLEQPMTVIERLPNAHLHRFTNGDQYCHQKYAAQFAQLVECHILNLPNYKVNTDELEDSTIIGKIGG